MGGHPANQPAVSGSLAAEAGAGKSQSRIRSATRGARCAGSTRRATAFHRGCSRAGNWPRQDLARQLILNSIGASSENIPFCGPSRGNPHPSDGDLSALPPTPSAARPIYSHDGSRKRWPLRPISFSPHSVQTLGSSRNIWRHFAPDRCSTTSCGRRIPSCRGGYLPQADRPLLAEIPARPHGYARSDGRRPIRSHDAKRISSFSCDAFEGIRAQAHFLTFSYYGVPDDADYAQIPGGRRALTSKRHTQAAATQARARDAFEQAPKARWQPDTSHSASRSATPTSWRARTILSRAGLRSAASPGPGPSSAPYGPAIRL